MTVTQLARALGLSRSTILYYESIGLIRKPRRTAGNYRAYNDADLDRLRAVCRYRAAGLRVADILALLNRSAGAAESVLIRRFQEIGEEIEALRQHQRVLARLLQHSEEFRRKAMISKDKWVEIMKSAGFTEKDMTRWHAEFEKAAPEDHQEFLQYLKIDSAEIEKIRQFSRDHIAS